MNKKTTKNTKNTKVKSPSVKLVEAMLPTIKLIITREVAKQKKAIKQEIMLEIVTHLKPILTEMKRNQKKIQQPKQKPASEMTFNEMIARGESIVGDNDDIDIDSVKTDTKILNENHPDMITNILNDTKRAMQGQQQNNEMNESTTNSTTNSNSGPIAGDIPHSGLKVALSRNYSDLVEKMSNPKTKKQWKTK